MKAMLNALRHINIGAMSFLECLQWVNSGRFQFPLRMSDVVPLWARAMAGQNDPRYCRTAVPAFDRQEEIDKLLMSGRYKTEGHGRKN